MKYNLKLAEEVIPGLQEFKKNAIAPEGIAPQDFMRGMLSEMANQVKVESDSNISVENIYFKGSDGINIRLRLFTPKNVHGSKPLLYWMHGGGTISGLPEQEDPLLYQLSLELECIVASVDYRLAPEHPYPTPLNDCYEGLEFLTSNHPKYEIDVDRVAVGGGSAGGLLSTSVALRARDENGPKIILQCLMYPMLDHRMITASHQEIQDVGVWDSPVNEYAFGCYLKDLKQENYDQAVPNLRNDLSNLPDTYIALGTVECLRDESIEYAQKLAASGVQVELHLFPGMVHVFDTLAPESKAAKSLWKTRIEALKRAFE